MSNLFCDGIRSVSLRSGVIRVELSQTAADGEPQAAGQLLIPEDQAKSFLATLTKRVEELAGPSEPAADQDDRSREPAAVDEDIGDLTT
jgi:hypothetical protein